MSSGKILALKKKTSTPLSSKQRPTWRCHSRGISRKKSVVQDRFERRYGGGVGHVDPTGKFTLIFESDSSDPYGATAYRFFERPIVESSEDSLFGMTFNFKNLFPEKFTNVVTRGQNYSEQVAIRSGIYDFEVTDFRGDIAPLLEGGRAIGTLKPNSVQGGKTIADRIYIHVMNTGRKSFKETGSQGCLGFCGAPGDWDRFSEIYQKGDTGTVILLRAEELNNLFKNLTNPQGGAN